MLNPKQTETVRAAVARVNVWEGSIRSGKTIGSILAWLLFINLMRHESGDFIMVGRTRDAVWRNVIGPMQDPRLFDRASKVVVGNYGAPTVTILGRRVLVMGANDVKAENVIRGLTVLGAYVDEGTVIPENFFVQLLGRMSPPGARMFMTTNPDSPNHWLKKQYLDRVGHGLHNWRKWHFVLDDNPSLSKDYVDSIKREFTGLWYKRFILGLWVQAEGAIYESWDDERHVVDELPDMVTIPGMGIDYGTTNDTRGLKLGLALGKDPCLYLINEWAPERSTDAGYSLSLSNWLGKPENVLEPPDWLYVDPAAASFKLQLFTDGITNVANATNEVVQGIRTVSALLSTGKLKVHRSCKNFIREIPGYVWDPKATKKGLDAPIKQDDHALDAARYAIHSTRSVWASYLGLNYVDEE